MALPKTPPEEQFGPYEVYERLGVGGMATVHRAKERGIEGFERVVALKRLLPHLAEDGTFVKAFVREAKLASMLQHVNIVQIFELGRVGAQYFISMEHIDGRDLRQVLRHARRVTGPPPIHITVGILTQLCDALDYAHAKCDEQGQPLRIVHRDVSPSNLLITSTGHLKVIDFGIAKAQSIHAQTQTGRVKGKLAYMAPEAIGGKDLDCRSDLFAAGVIAHELLTARPLFASKNEYQTILKVQRGDILPPSTFNQACPPELDAIVLKALARSADDRFATAGELREELLALRHQYQYASGSREIANWIEWAFSLEAPSGGFSAAGTDTPFTNTIGGNTGGPGLPSPRAGSSSGPHHTTPSNTPESSIRSAIVRARPISNAGQSGQIRLPGVDPMPPRPEFLPATFPVSDDDGGRARSTIEPQADEDEAAVAAWGSGDAARSAGVPVELDDVPDVSDKAAITLPDLAAVRRTGSSPGTEEQDTQNDGASGSTKPGMAVVGPQGVPVTPAPAATAATARTTTATSARTVLGRAVTNNDAAVTAAPLRQASASSSASVEIEPSPSEAWFTNTSFGASGAFSAADVSASTSATSPTRFGAAMVQRNQQGGTAKRVVAVAVIAAAVGAGGYWYSQRSSNQTAAPVVAPVANGGYVKFVVEPADAEIRIAGQPAHVGAPYQLDLAAGTYQVEIHRDGFKTYLTSLEMVAGEKQSLRVVLETAGATNDSTLVITSAPAGADIEIDGQATHLHTPAKLDVQPGPHVIVLRQAGVEKWRQEFVAERNSNAEFGAVLSDERVRERAKHRSTWIPPTNTPEPVEPSSGGNGSGSSVEPRIDAATGSGSTTNASGSALPPVASGTGSGSGAGSSTNSPNSNPAGSAAGSATPTVIVAPVIPPPVVQPVVPPVVPQPPKPTTPPLLKPNTLSRVSGEMPKFSATSSDDLPATVSSKVCVDAGGRVSSVGVLTKLDGDARGAIESAIRTWRYSPYRENNVAQPACFIVTFRLK